MAASLLCGGLPGEAGAGAASEGIGEVAPGTTELISIDYGDSPVDGASDGARMSANGLHVAFTSEATDIVSGDNNALRDVFVRDLEAGVAELVSIDRFGGAANGASGVDGSGLASVSADGRYVAFQSAATDLVAGDTNAMTDVFVRDMTAGTTTLVSVDSAGGASDAASGAPVLSDDGRTVAFWSNATDLVIGDTNAMTDVFVRDLDAGTTTIVSVDSASGPSDGFSGSSPIGLPAISADGDHVAFGSGATDLVGSDTNGQTDVFVRNLEAGVTTLVSVDADGGPTAAFSTEPALSADGSVVAFWSPADDLVAGDTNGMNDVFVRDLDLGITTRVSVDTAGGAADGESRRPDISADGRLVTFQSVASDLVAGDTNAALDVFLRDLQLGTTALVSVDSSGGSADDGSFQPSIDGVGATVAFTSAAHDLVIGGTTGTLDLFVRGASTPTGCAPEPVTVGPFSDVGPLHPFCDEITWLVASGITSGYADGTYRSTSPVSRAAMAAFLYRFEESPAFIAPGTATFTDVPTSHPFFHEIEWLASTGITGGFPDGTFRPSSSVTRQAMAAFLYRQSGEPPFTDPSTASFTDVPLGANFFHEIEWLASTGITTGFPDGTFKPNAIVTRQAMAAFLQRLDALAPPAPGTFIAVGEDGRRMLSVDGATWTHDIVLRQLTYLGFGGGTFLASGTPPVRSTDGIEWLPSTVPAAPLAFGSATWIAGTTRHSLDGGTTWISNTGAGGNTIDVTYGDDGFVAVGLGMLRARSADGITWGDIVTPGGFGYLSGVAFGEGRYVAVGGGVSGEGVRTYSNDGVTWTLPSGTGAALEDVAYGNGMFIAVGASGRRMRSLDGSSWNNDVTGGVKLRSIAFGNGAFVAVGDDGRRIRTVDGITWTDDVADDPTMSTGFHQIAFGNGFFVAGGGDGRRMRSVDGITWTHDTVLHENVTNGNFLLGVAAGDGTVVAVGNEGRRVRSTDGGIEWIGQMIGGGSLRSVAAGAGTFVAVGDGGRRILSTDGAAWTDDVTGGVHLAGVAWGGGTFVAVGDGGRRLRSNDGAAWTDDVSGGAALHGVAYGKGTFVAVGDGGRRILSTDGATWTDDAAGGAALRSVAYGNRTFVAVGDSGRRMRSTDGVTWTHDVSGGVDLFGVTYGGGSFVAVGEDGRRMRSVDGITWTDELAPGITSAALFSIAFLS